jgi:hypothetical protein
MRHKTRIELTYSWERLISMTFGHLAMGVEDTYKTCDDLCNKGAKIVRDLAR